jgi:alanine dehydrogenase
VTLPYALEIATRGLEDAVHDDPALAQGVNVFGGRITNEAVAEAHGLEAAPLSSMITGAPE